MNEDVNGFVNEKQRAGQSKFLKVLFDDLLNFEYEFERTEDLIAKQYEMEQHELEEQKRQRRLEIQRQREQEIENARRRRIEEDEALMEADLERERKRSDVLGELQNQINNAIPNFLLGEVQLTEIHLKMGFTQDDINHVNQNRDGFMVTANISATHDELDDFSDFLANDIQRVGMRITKYGKILIQGGSIKGYAA